jgi:hypothetical protein
MLDRVRPRLVIALLVVGSAARAGPRQDGADSSLRLTVRIYDHAGLPAAALAKAEANATHVFGAIGIAPGWLHCRPGQVDLAACEQRPAPTDVFVMVMPHGTHHAGSSHVLGRAILSDVGRGSHVYVFHDRVQALAAEYQQVDGAAILGHVLAHEIGHLLLGSNAHSSGGIMAARWFGKELRKVAKGELLFSTPEHARIHAELVARMSDEAAPSP